MLTAELLDAIKAVIATAGTEGVTRTALAQAFSFHVKGTILAEAIAFLESTGEVRVERRDGFGRTPGLIIWIGEAPAPQPEQTQLAFFTEDAEAS